MAYLRGGSTPPPKKIKKSDFFLKSEGKEGLKNELNC